MRPGPRRPSDLVLSGPKPVPSDLLSWFEGIASGASRPKSGSVVLHDRTGRELSRINFREAYPTRIEVDPEQATWRLTGVLLVDFRE